jgi:hypothetical protein
MRKVTILMAIIWAVNCLYAQQIQHPLNKIAQKGSLYDAQLSDDGNLSLVYGFMAKKEHKFINYVFDPSLKLLKEEESAEPYTTSKLKDQPLIQYEYIRTYVGGCSSFDVLSMDLHVSKVAVTKTWDNKGSEYKVAVTENEIGSGKDGKFNYKGYVGYYDAETGANLVLVKEKEKGSDDGVVYKLATITLDSKVTEIPIGDLAKYTLVYSTLVKKNPDAADKYDDKNLADYNAFFIFAPFKGCPADPKDFVALMVDGTGKTLFKTTITMPLIATTIIEMIQEGEDLYFFGLTSTGKGSHYRYEFMDYSNISNPCYPDFYNYRDNQRETDVTKCEASNLILMKMTGDKLVYITATPTESLQAKKVVPPSIKKAPKEPFSRFSINAFELIDNGDLLVTGQKKVIIMLDGTSHWAYEDITCFHFDKSGNLRAEYCIEPALPTQKNDKIFKMMQQFVLSEDKNSVHWIVYEPEGRTGYANYHDFYNGWESYYAGFVPEIFKIDLKEAKLHDAVLPLGAEYLIYGSLPYIRKGNTSEVLFLGHTRKDDSLGLTKYDFN